MLPLVTLVLVLCTQAWATSVAKRATCTVTSFGDASKDDVPTIAAAIKSCGNGGIIVLPAGHTYMIRSQLSFAGCTNCQFQVEGTMKVRSASFCPALSEEFLCLQLSDDTTFWQGKSNVISLSAM
jgi:galacturan 1,4-alpha-galacturonidase